MAQLENPNIPRLRREAKDLLNTALNSKGYVDSQSVYRALAEHAKQDKNSFVVPARTIGRYMSEGPPLSARGVTYDSLASLGELAGIKDELLEVCGRLWSQSHRREQDHDAQAIDDGHMLPSTWYAVIPRQTGRDYASIDLVTIEKQVGDLFEGKIIRVSPPRERGYRWNLSGTRYGATALFAYFRPRESDNLTSRGTISLRRTGYRRLKYEGCYTRLSEESSDFLIRDYFWQRTLPQKALHDVALLDLDNTLRVGWTVRPWLAFLSRDGWQGAGACLEAIQVQLDQYSMGKIGHDDLVDLCAGAYAKMATGKRAVELEDAAEVFVKNYENDALHDFVLPLISSLKNRGVAPVIVSGAPAELVKFYADRLNVEEYYGMVLGVDEDGIYDGRIVANTGITDVKRSIVRRIRNTGRGAIIAVGDSDSDIPLWDAAEYKIIVGTREPESDWPPERTLTIIPGESSLSSIEEWLSVNLESSDIPELIEFDPRGD